MSTEYLRRMQQITQSDEVRRLWLEEQLRHERSMGGAWKFAQKGGGKPKLTLEMAQEIRRRHAAGELQKDLAKAFGVGRSSVHSIVAGDTWQDGTQQTPSRERRRYSYVLSPEEMSAIRRNAVKRKLTWEQVREMRKLHTEGRSIASLAEQYNISPSAAQRIMAGETWKETT